jgi:hypothetical protein
MLRYAAEGVEDLLARCHVAREAGTQFPEVWDKILRVHPLVLGLPIQVVTGSKPQLKIQLINGQFICLIDGGYSLD